MVVIDGFFAERRTTFLGHAFGKRGKAAETSDRASRPLWFCGPGTPGTISFRRMLRFERNFATRHFQLSFFFFDIDIDTARTALKTNPPQQSTVNRQKSKPLALLSFCLLAIKEQQYRDTVPAHNIHSTPQNPEWGSMRFRRASGRTAPSKTNRLRKKIANIPFIFICG